MSTVYASAFPNHPGIVPCLLRATVTWQPMAFLILPRRSPGLLLRRRTKLSRCLSVRKHRSHLRKLEMSQEPPLTCRLGHLLENPLNDLPRRLHLILVCRHLARNFLSNRECRCPCPMTIPTLSLSCPIGRRPAILASRKVPRLREELFSLLCRREAVVCGLWKRKIPVTAVTPLRVQWIRLILLTDRHRRPLREYHI